MGTPVIDEGSIGKMNAKLNELHNKYMGLEYKNSQSSDFILSFWKFTE